MRHIFRAYDIRGIWNRDLDQDVALKIGMGLGSFLREDLGFKRASLGHDIRLTSAPMHHAVLSGLVSTGVDVIDLGECSFGIALYGGYTEGVDVSCLITASHLGPEWNGLKVYFGDGVGFPEEHIMAVRDRVLEGRFHSVDWSDVGRVEVRDHRQGYVDFWKGRYVQKDGGHGLGIAVDCGGSMCLSAPRVLRAVGARVTEINCGKDPLFRGRPSEPKPEFLGELRDAVVEGNLDFGVAFDGDGDRAVVVDDAGRFLSSDRLGIIIARELVKERGGTVLANVESSMAIEDVLEPLGADVRRIKVGHTYLTLEAKRTGAVFGVERSGHIVVPKHVLFDDAIVAPLEVMRIMRETGKRLSQLVDEVPQYPMIADAVQCPDETKFEVVVSLAERIAADGGNVNTMDGVRVDMEEGWALVRASNTSPLIRITVEGKDEVSRDRLMAEYSGLLREEIRKVSA